jgi:hypothetical protein
VTFRLINFVELVLKHSKIVTGSCRTAVVLRGPGEGVSVKIGLCLFLVRFHSSDEDGVEFGGCGRRLGHGNSLVTARNSEGDRERVDETGR